MRFQNVQIKRGQDTVVRCDAMRCDDVMESINGRSVDAFSW